MKRHIGKMANTDQRLVVVFMQIPGREDHALVIPTDTLPARYEQAVMEILESPEGQAEETLANTLSRRLMPDTGKPVLQALHDAGILKPVPIANIMMMPMPNMPFPLVTILEGMGRSVVASPVKQAAAPVADMSAVEKYNQIAVNQKIEGVENRRAIAQNLLIEAEMLEGEARKKRARAYSVAPEMAPKTTPLPAVVALPMSMPAKKTRRTKKTASE
jgi:hypothetical protein